MANVEIINNGNFNIVKVNGTEIDDVLDIDININEDGARFFLAVSAETYRIEHIDADVNFIV